jgi:hypothetical protein
MYKIIACIIAAGAYFLVNPAALKAESFEVGQSAVPKFRQVDEAKFDYREYTLRKFLAKNNSPLTPYSSDFIRTADYYGIDWRMVPAISGVESTFGKRIPRNSYNAYGWANGRYQFKSWPESIDLVSKTLKTKYIDKGAVSINKIARIYAPPSNTWGRNVKFFVGKISPLPLSFDI